MMLVRVSCNEWAFSFRRDLWNAFYNLKREPIQAHLTLIGACLILHKNQSDLAGEF